MKPDPEPMECTRFIVHGAHMFYAGSAFAVCCGRTRAQASADGEDFRRGMAAIDELVGEINVRRLPKRKS